MTKKAIFVLTGRLLKDSGTDVCGRHSLKYISNYHQEKKAGVV